MYGVSRITGTDDMMLVNYSDVDSMFMSKTLNILADAGVIVDMISQTAPLGGSIRFSFTAPSHYVDVALKALGEGKAAPMISSGYGKLYLYGEDMVESSGVAARALAALNTEKVEITMITTSDLDISLLVRQEDMDVAMNALRNAFML